MKMNVGLVTLTMVGLLGSIASCSSDSDDGDESSAGTSSGSGGRAGATSGGSKSSGGSSGSAGTSNNGGSANPTGGTTSGGSSFGGFNFGGAGFDPDDYACDPVPQPGSSCDSSSQPCLNESELCYCNVDEWACMAVGQGEGGAGPGGGLGDIECPATKPMTGGDCGDSVGFCPYGGQFMGCACYNGAWLCN